MDGFVTVYLEMKCWQNRPGKMVSWVKCFEVAKEAVCYFLKLKRFLYLKVAWSWRLDRGLIRFIKLTISI